jgi:hypothetical protein
MRQKSFFVFFLVVLMTVESFAQNKVVTNSDLEKYKEKRLQAEADYDRQVQLGKVPSREELQRREQERQKYLSEFARQKAIEEAEYWRAQANEFQSQNQAYAVALANANNRYNTFSQPTIVYGFGGILPVYNGYYGYGYKNYNKHNFGGFYNWGRKGGIWGSVNYGSGINTNSGRPIAVAPLGTPPPPAGTILVAPANNFKPHQPFRRFP